MWMTDFIRQVQRNLVDDYGFPPNPDHPTMPAEGSVPDGRYPMTIDGVAYDIEVRNDKLVIHDGARR